MKYKKLAFLIAVYLAKKATEHWSLLNCQKSFPEKIVFRRSVPSFSHGKMYKRYTFEGSAPFGSELARVG